jgi:GDPmannose 4,6-dehydratase
LQKKIVLGNLDANRDWGFAGDYVDGMWRMLQQDKPGDYVLATGETHSIREFAELAFKEIGIDIIWEGEAEKEKGLNSTDGEILIEVSKEFYRPAEVEVLLGDASKAKKELDWGPVVRFESLVRMMVEHDLHEVEMLIDNQKTY